MECLGYVMDVTNLYNQYAIITMFVICQCYGSFSHNGNLLVIYRVVAAEMVWVVNECSITTFFMGRCTIIDTIATYLHRK